MLVVVAVVVEVMIIVVHVPNLGHDRRGLVVVITAVVIVIVVRDGSGGRGGPHIVSPLLVASNNKNHHYLANLSNASRLHNSHSFEHLRKCISTKPTDPRNNEPIRKWC